MKTSRTPPRQGRKEMARALVHRGTRSQHTSLVAKLTRKLTGETMCERCGNVYRDKRWHEASPGERLWPVGFAWTVCPACRQVESQQYFGRVLLRGDGALRKFDEIRTRIANVAARARFTQPQRRIVSIERNADEIAVLTTSQKLAHRIVASLVQAFGGKASLSWAPEDGELRAVWTWGERIPESGKNAPVLQAGALKRRRHHHLAGRSR